VDDHELARRKVGSRPAGDLARSVQGGSPQELPGQDRRGGQGVPAAAARVPRRRVDGRRLHPDTLTRRFNRLVDRARVPRIRLQDVRHTYATLAMDAGADPKVLSDRIGHANTSITLQVYAHRSTGLDRPIAEKMSQLIAAATEAATNC